MSFAAAIRSTSATIALLALSTSLLSAEDISTLTAREGGVKISGEITGFKEDRYQIVTSHGAMEIPAKHVNCEGPGCRVERVIADWQPGMPDGLAEVTMPDGSVTLSGTVVEVAHGNIRIDTQLGEFDLPLDAISCDGPGCPSRAERVAYVEADNLVAETLANAPAADIVNTSLGGSGDITTAPTAPKAPEGAEVAAALPSSPLTAPTLRISGPEAVINDLLPIALGTYADTFGGKLSLTDTGKGTDVGVVAENGDKILRLSGLTAVQPVEQVALLANGKSDVAITIGEAPNAALSLVAKAGKGDLDSFEQQRVLAMDGLVAIVSPESQIKSILDDDVQAILAGQVTNWSELGGPDMAINVLASSESHLRGMLPEGTQTRNGDSAQIVQAVLQDPAAIGFVPFSARGEARTLPLSSTCGVETEATAVNLKTEQYPLMQRVVAYNTNDAASSELADFLAYLESAELDQGIRRSGFVDLGIETEKLEAASARVAREAESYDIEVLINGAKDLVADMDGKERLSTVFRFDNASTRLDRRSQRDLRRVVDFIAAHPDAEFMIVGFTDTVGTYDENRELAQRRADTVLAALREADTGNEINSAKVGTKGVGELYTLACNERGAERAINRRVEVWMAR
ncbi:OmpA family protein [Halovulum sp. GXIMD14793]